MRCDINMCGYVYCVYAYISRSLALWDWVSKRQIRIYAFMFILCIFVCLLDLSACVCLCACVQVFIFFLLISYTTFSPCIQLPVKYIANESTWSNELIQCCAWTGFWMFKEKKRHNETRSLLESWTMNNGWAATINNIKAKHTNVSVFFEELPVPTTSDFHKFSH